MEDLKRLSEIIVDNWAAQMNAQDDPNLEISFFEVLCERYLSIRHQFALKELIVILTEPQPKQSLIQAIELLEGK